MEVDNKKYTLEQKIVSAVWVHEKKFNNQTWKDIQGNFIARFNITAPRKSTLLNWEKKLFSTGNIHDDNNKIGRPCARLMHVPYVKQSLKESPNLSLRDRARNLGLSRSTLLKILKDDLNMKYEVNFMDDFNKNFCYNNGQWTENKNNNNDNEKQ